jgi:hypothetical integral membrane protein (TIGR02206 family)
MSLAVFVVWAVPMLLVIRRIRFWHKVGERRHAKRLQMAASLAVSVLVPLCMATQIFLLWKMGLAGVGTVLPLHLCSFMGVLTPFMLLLRSAGLLEFTLYLGVPGALAALIFPAVMPSPWPLIMEGAFFSMHALIALAPFLRMANGARPRPLALGRVFLWGNILLLMVMGVNAIFKTNYFFLKNAPTGTPLYLLQNMGQAAYISTLEIAALVLLKLETLAFNRVIKQRA